MCTCVSGTKFNRLSNVVVKFGCALTDMLHIMMTLYVQHTSTCMILWVTLYNITLN